MNHRALKRATKACMFGHIATCLVLAALSWEIGMGIILGVGAGYAIYYLRDER